MKVSLAFALMVLVGVFFALEVTQPFFFSQDDNLAQFLPVHLLCGRTLFEEGVIATFNPYQGGGSPVIQTGTYAATYPLLYFAYACARFLLGNEFLTLEILAFLHVILGFIATYALGRSLGFADGLSALIATAFVMSGFTFVAGRSWYYTLPILVFLPLVFIGLCCMLGRGTGLFRPRYSFLVFGIALALLFHSGNAQLWVYTCMFVALFVVMYCKSLTKWGALQLLAGGLVALILISPILVIQLDYLRFVSRADGHANGLLSAWVGFFIPYPLHSAFHNPRWGSNSYEAVSALYFGGGITLLFFIVGLVLYLFRGPSLWRRRSVQHSVFIGALASLFLVAGDETPVWGWLHSVGPLQTFNHALKILPFVNFFVALAAAFVLERLVGERKRYVAAGLVVLLGATSLNALSARSSFFDYGFAPYPELPEPLFERLEGRAVFSRYPVRSTEYNYFESLPHNLPTVYRIRSLSGLFDPMVNTTPEYIDFERHLKEAPLAMLSQFGVSLLLDSSPVRNPSRNPTTRIYEGWWSLDSSRFQTELAEYPSLLRDTSVTVYENSSVQPFVSVNGQVTGAAISMNGNAVTIASSEPMQGTLSVGLLRQSALRALVDGQPATVSADEWGRMRIELAGGGRLVEIKSNLPTLTVICVLLVLSFVLAVLLTGWRHEIFASPLR